MSPEQRILLEFCAPASGVIIVNDRVCIHTEGFRRVVLVHGVIVAHYDKNDRAAEEYAMLTLLDSGYAEQEEIACAFSCSARSIRRYSQKFALGGLPALGRTRGRPSEITPQKTDERDRTILRMKERGFSNRPGHCTAPGPCRKFSKKAITPVRVETTIQCMPAVLRERRTASPVGSGRFLAGGY
jgi:hypothetical protein